MLAALSLLLVTALGLSSSSGPNLHPQVPNPKIPSGGTPVITPDTLALQGDPQYGTAETVPVTASQGIKLPFTTAVKATTTKRPPNDWQFEVGTDAIVPVQKGDTLFATVWVRALQGQPETGEGRTVLDFQVKGGDYSKSVSQPIAIPKQWTKIEVPFTAGYTTPAGGANVCFRLGTLVQTIEIGGLTVVDYGTSVSVKDLPHTSIHYAGEEANAAWRKAALARIEKIRKGDLVVKVVDKAGHPLPGAKVQVRMIKSAFLFGTAVGADELFLKGPDGDRYRAVILKDFNRATVENHLKWQMWYQDQPRTRGIEAVDWLDAHGLSVRGHNLVWPSWRNSPPGLRDLSPDALRQKIDDHIDDEVTAMKGKVDLWDVVNEPFDNHEILDIIGRNQMVEWFQRVKRIDPKPRLFLNDYPPLDGSALDNPHLNSFYETLSWLMDQGAPLEGIGFQCHIGGEAIPPTQVLTGLDRFAKLGLPIEITEFDINTQDREFQARYMRDFMIAMFSHPAVTAFTQWGFWAKRHWLPESALYADDWTLRPHGKVYLDYVNKTWRTNVDGVTNAAGSYRTRGFYGTYTVTVTLPGRTTAVVVFPLVKGKSTPVVVTVAS